MNEELIEKCRLTEEEILESCRQAWDEERFGAPFPETALYDNALAIPMLNTQISKAIPLISAEAREEGRKEIMDWIQSFKINGGRLTVDSLIDTMEAHSPYKKYLWQVLKEQEGEG